MLTVIQPQRLVSYCVIVSAGTLLAALGLGGAAMKGAALFYLANSVLATGAFFMLSEMITRTQQSPKAGLSDQEESSEPDFSDEEVGIVIPAAMAFLGMSFLGCALLVTGLPPLSGFIGKFLILSAALDLATLETLPASVWVLWAAVLSSSLVGVIALCRMGMRLFWSSDEIITPRLQLIEAAPVAVLLLLSVVLTAGTGPAMDYLSLAADSLSSPQTYIDAVLGNSSQLGVEGDEP
jgi:multicomponent K+:H+ antiporter subunit D